MYFLLPASLPAQGSVSLSSCPDVVSMLENEKKMTVLSIKLLVYI